MKRKILFAVLSIFVIFILVFSVGCFGSKGNSGDSATSSEQDQNNRLSALESGMASKANSADVYKQTDVYTKVEVDSLLDAVSAPDLGGYVTQAEFDTMVDTYDNIIAALQEQIEELQGGGGSSEPSSGVVTVAIDSEAEPYVFTTNSTASIRVIPVKITNGTVDYQEVIFNVTLRCTSADLEADVTDLSSVNVNGVEMSLTPVTTWTECRYIYCVWTDISTILVSPGGSAIVYVYFEDFSTDGNEIWEATLSDVIATEL